MNRSQAELLLLLQTGDRDAFAALYHGHKAEVYGFCLRMLRDSEAAQDVAQQVFLALLQQSAQVREPEHLRGWLLTIARRACNRVIAKQSRIVPLDNEDSLFTEPATDPHESGSMIRRLELALKKLPEDLREVILLREYHDLSYRSIAEVIEAPESTVKFRLFAARRKLHELLSPGVRKEGRYGVS